MCKAIRLKFELRSWSKKIALYFSSKNPKFHDEGLRFHGCVHKTATVEFYEPFQYKPHLHILFILF
jgi:hypothetical protein